MYVDLHVNACYFCLILTKLLHYQQILIKIQYKKFYKNPSSGRRVVPRERTDGTTYTTTDVLIAFHNFCERA